MSNSSPAQVKTFLANWSLPIFMTKENKSVMGVWLAFANLFLYLFSNHFHFFTPQLLPLSTWDNQIPFVPHTVWIYMSEYVFFIVVYITCKDLMNLNKYFYSFLFLQIISVIIFLAWPTTYPRDLFPLTQDLDSLTYFAFSNLRITDTPANCCPSLHVSSVYLSVFIFLDDQRKKFPFFFLWGTAIALSTLTTKQHYIIDVVTGFMMAVSVYWIFHRYISYRTAEPKTLR